jgi:hypothetical protein
MHPSSIYMLPLRSKGYGSMEMLSMQVQINLKLLLKLSRVLLLMKCALLLLKKCAPLLFSKTLKGRMSLQNAFTLSLASSCQP